MNLKTINTGSDFSGVGAFDVAIHRLGINQKKQFACDMDKFARRNYLANFGTKEDLELLDHKDVKFIDSVYYRMYNSKIKPTDEELNQAVELASIYSRKFSFYYPWDVYQREIPNVPLDQYMTSPPCQAFSLAGKRKGKDDLRGILFFNSLEFIQKNKPKTFIFENVKGLLSDNNGKTFSEWINFLGGCTVNGVPVIFPYEDSVPYHVFWTVLNAKKHGVPQNRERVFIVGIREDFNYGNFQWPEEIQLTTKLKDVLENEVDEKYFLSEKMLENLTREIKKNGEIANLNKGGERGSVYSEECDSISCLSATDFKQPKQIQVKVEKINTKDELKVGTWRTHKDGQGFRECEDGTCPTIPARAREDGSGQPVIKVCAFARSENAKEKRKKNKLKTGKDTGSLNDRKLVLNNQDTSDTILANANSQKEGLICIPVLTPDRAEKRQNGRRFKEDGDEMFTITTQDKHGVYDGYRIRRLTPTECFRLMDFPDTHVEKARNAQISDSQLYKQAGNSIVVKHLNDLILKTMKIINL